MARVELLQRRLLRVTGGAERRAQRRLDLRVGGLLQVHEAAVDHARDEAERVADRQRRRPAERVGGGRGEDRVGRGRGDEVQRDADLPAHCFWMAIWSVSGWPSTIDVEGEAVRVAGLGQQLLGLVRVVGVLGRPAPGRSRRRPRGTAARSAGHRGAGRSRWPRGRCRSTSASRTSTSPNAGLVAPVLSNTGKPTIVPPISTTVCLDFDQVDGVGAERHRDVGLPGDDRVGPGLRVDDDLEDDGVERESRRRSRPCRSCRRCRCCPWWLRRCSACTGRSRPGWSPASPGCRRRPCRR